MKRLSLKKLGFIRNHLSGEYLTDHKGRVFNTQVIWYNKRYQIVVNKQLVSGKQKVKNVKLYEGDSFIGEYSTRKEALNKTMERTYECNV